MSDGTFLNWQPGDAPFRKPALKPMRIEPSGTQRGDRLEGKDAIRTAAIGDDLLVARQAYEAVLEIGEGNVHRARQMPEGEFIFRPDVEDRHEAIAHSLRQFLARYRLEGIAFVEVARNDALDLGEAMGVPPKVGMGAIRFSLGRGTTQDEIETVVEGLGAVLSATQ